VFKLWANHDLTLTEDRGKITVSFSTSQASGRNTKDVGFTEQNWGKVTRGYLTSIEKMPALAFDQAIEQAQEFARSSRFSEDSAEDDDEYERAVLVEIGDGNASECQSAFFHFVQCTHILP
jgi:hypothetical protein